MGVVEGDHLGHGLDRRVEAPAGQVGVQVSLELVEQHLQLMLADLVVGQGRGQVDHHSAQPAHGRQVGLHDHIDLGVMTEILPRHADARAAQAVLVEELGVVGERCSDQLTAEPPYRLAPMPLP